MRIEAVGGMKGGAPNMVRPVPANGRPRVLILGAGFGGLAAAMGLKRTVHICAQLADSPVELFRYRHLGDLATIGRRAAVADFGRIRLSGLSAWLVWNLAHLWFVGFRNRFVVSWIGVWPISATSRAPD